MRVSGFRGEGTTPSIGLRQGCPLSATLFGLFIDGLHHYLETMAPAAGIQCGKTIKLHLHLLQAVLVPVLQYGCQGWGMHSPRVAAANRARLDLQRLYDYYLRTICGLLPSTPHRMLFAELSLLPLQAPFTTRFAWTSLSAFQGGACNMASSVAGCLRSVGYDMPRVFDVMPLLDIDCIVEPLTVQLRDMGSAALYCPCAAPTRGVVSCTYEHLRRRYCHLPVSGGRMQRFLRFWLGCHSLPIAAGRFAGAAHVPRAHRVCLACNSGAVGDNMHMVFEYTALASLRSRYASLFTGSTDTMSDIDKRDLLSV
ncbi:TPA: hypothetical protein ACH3X1_008781 [Trebouxia sp. C0004]